MPSVEKTSVEGAVRTGQKTADTTASKVCEVNHAVRGILIVADESNGAQIYVGGDAGVTNQNGMPISAGKGLFIEVADPSSLYVVTQAGSLTLSWMVL